MVVCTFWGISGIFGYMWCGFYYICSMRKVFKQISFNAGSYVNIYTGQVLSDEIQNITSVNVFKDNVVSISYENYCMYNNGFIAYLPSRFNIEEVGIIMLLSGMVVGSNNIVKYKNRYISGKKLVEVLPIGRDKGMRLYRKMIEENIIAEAKEPVKGGIVLLFNPYLMKKSRNINSVCASHFNDVSKEFRANGKEESGGKESESGEN